MQYENIKACIMAGGKGTRLRPLTTDMPKPLAKLLGKPIITYILELLKSHNVSEAAIAVGYQGEKIRTELENLSILDLEFVTEDIPLGTAGAVKNAMQDCNDDFIVISGDCLCDLDLSAAYAFHKANNSMVTIIGTRVADPREYGLILCDEDGGVISFLEKPSYHNCSSDLASTGIYILSPNIFDYIDDNKSVDFANDVFPKLLLENMPIYAFEDSGYWCDIGDTMSYAKCQQDMLMGRIKCNIDAKNIDGVYYKTGVPISADENIHIASNVYIGEGVTLAKGTVIGEYSVLCDNVTVGSSSTVTSSILLDSVYIGEDVSIVSSICCSGVRLEDNVAIMEGSVIGSNAVVQRNAIVCDNVMVWANKTVPSGFTLSDDLQFGTARQITVDEEGIIGQTNIKITPELCAKIGSSIGSIKPFGLIGVAYNDAPCSEALYHAIVSGIMASGATVWDFKSCIENQFKFCLAKSTVDFGIYIDGGNITTIRLFEKGGLSTCRAVERKLEGNINRGEFKRVIPSKMGNIVDMSGLVKLYEIELLKQCDMPLSSQVNIKCTNKTTKQLLERTLVQLGCELGDDITINIRSGGGIIIYDMETTLTTPLVQTLLCLSEFLKGEDVCVSETSPRIIDSIAKEHNRQVYRYPDCPCDQKDVAIRQKAINKPFLRDELMMAIRLLSFMTHKKLRLFELAKLIPEFEQSNRLVPINGAPGTLLKRLNCSKTRLSEGLVLSNNGVEALIRPIKSGRGIMIFSESQRAVQNESAVEICDFFENIIRQANELEA